MKNLFVKPTDPYLEAIRKIARSELLSPSTVAIRRSKFQPMASAPFYYDKYTKAYIAALIAGGIAFALLNLNVKVHGSSFSELFMLPWYNFIAAGCLALILGLIHALATESLVEYEFCLTDEKYYRLDKTVEKKSCENLKLIPKLEFLHFCNANWLPFMRLQEEDAVNGRKVKKEDIGKLKYFDLFQLNAKFRRGYSTEKYLSYESDKTSFTASEINMIAKWISILVGQEKLEFTILLRRAFLGQTKQVGQDCPVLFEELYGYLRPTSKVDKGKIEYNSQAMEMV